MMSLTVSGLAAGQPLSALGRHRSPASPYVEVWTNRDDVYRRGDKLKLYFRTDVDAYVTVFRVDTDGRVRVLFPSDPWDDNYAVGGEQYRVDPRDDGYTFRVDDYPGQGYLFAVATRDPFVYEAFVRNQHWDYRLIGTNGRIAGDPYVAIGDLIADIVPAGYADYSYDVVPYYVEQRYEYPRFLCYDCHSYVSWPYWDPYAHSCFRFRIVIYDDPYYYPARVYQGTRVVYRRPNVLVPRYVFKDRGPGDRDVVTVRERPVDDAGRRRIEPGATRRTLPGGVLLPAPAAKRPETADPGVRRIAPTTGNDGNTAGRATPTLERRDPAKAPSTVRRPAAPAGPERTQAAPPKATPERTRPSGGTVRRTDPPKATPPRAQPKRSEPARQPARAEPRRSEPRATPPRSEPKRSESPPRRKN
jgi:hypothetical protein